MAQTSAWPGALGFQNARAFFVSIFSTYRYLSWLVVSTPLKNIRQLGWLFPIYGKIKNGPNHQPVYYSIYEHVKVLPPVIWQDLNVLPREMPIKNIERRPKSSQNIENKSKQTKTSSPNVIFKRTPTPVWQWSLPQNIYWDRESYDNGDSIMISNPIFTAKSYVQSWYLNYEYPIHIKFREVPDPSDKHNTSY